MGNKTENAIPSHLIKLVQSLITVWEFIEGKKVSKILEEINKGVNTRLPNITCVFHYLYRWSQIGVVEESYSEHPKTNVKT